MTNSCRKGKVGEREVANMLKRQGFADARRGQQHSGGEDSPDVVGLDGYHIEVKRTEKFRLWDAMEQAENDSGEDNIPIVMHRKSRKDWVVVIGAYDFLGMVRLIEEQKKQIINKVQKGD